MCLGCEVFGRWGPQCAKLVPKLARERTHGLHSRIRNGVAKSFNTGGGAFWASRNRKLLQTSSYTATLVQIFSLAFLSQWLRSQVGAICDSMLWS